MLDSWLKRSIPGNERVMGFFSDQSDIGLIPGNNRVVGLIPGNDRVKWSIPGNNRVMGSILGNEKIKCGLDSH